MLYHLVSDLSCVYGFAEMSTVWPSAPLLCYTSFYHGDAAILKPWAATPQVCHSHQLSQKCQGSVLWEGRAAVQIGQTLVILGMRKWSRLLAEGVERCPGSAAIGGGEACTHKHTHAHQHLQTSSWELRSQIMNHLLGDFVVSLIESKWRSVTHSSSSKPAKVELTPIIAHPLCPFFFF